MIIIVIFIIIARVDKHFFTVNQIWKWCGLEAAQFRSGAMCEVRVRSGNVVSGTTVLEDH